MSSNRISGLHGEQRERLLSEWESSVRTLPAVQALDESSFVDNMPQLLSAIIECNERGRPTDLGAVEQLARTHAGRRLRNGLDLQQLVGEYRLLRSCILRVLGEQYGRRESGSELIARIETYDQAIDAAIAASVDCYSRARERAAREVELRLRRLLATLPVAVWVADANGHLRLSNEAARRLWGGESVPLEQYDRFKAWWPDGRRISSSEWGLSRALRTGEVTIDEEVKIETFDGSHKTIRNSAAPILDDAGRIIGGVAVNEDITILKRAEAMRDLFAGILGHDLRSPLNAITMSVALLLQSGGLTDAQQKAAMRIDAGAARIQQLIDGLLDFTRARFGMGFPIAPASVDMGDLCARIVDEVRGAHPDRAILLERAGDLRGVWDAARVAQVISNLVGNALEHGQDPITVAAADAGDAVLVSVSNQGGPIPEEKSASLFEPFRKGDDSSGIGLGLFIAREIVRSHGGTIELASTEETTTFTTRWPRLPR